MITCEEHMTDLQFYIHLVVSISTIVMSGVASAVVTYQLNKHRDERQLRRQKLEELFTALADFKRSFDARNFAIFQWVGNRISPEQSQELQLKYIEKSGDSRAKATMLVGVYFHEFQIALDALEATQNRISETYDQFRTMYRDAHGEAGPRFSERFEGDLHAFEAEYRKLLEIIRLSAMLV
jgi:hypothetical protein